jgi:hypothetical protein
MISISMYCTEVYIDEIIEKLNIYVKIIRVENITTRIDKRKEVKLKMKL